MRQLLIRLKRGTLALVALVLPGCGREPNLTWILDGRVGVPSAERHALRTLFEGTRASAVELVDGDGLLGGFGARTVQVADGHVVGLATLGDVPVEPVGALSELRRLTFYRSRLESLEGLGPWPKLEELRLDFTPLGTLDGVASCCPGLTALSVSHGPIRDLGPLGGLTKLERLRLEHSGLVRLDSAPHLPSLRELSLTSGPLESLSGLERFPRLERLLLFGFKGLRDLSDLPALEGLRELELYQNGLTALSGLPALPSLERIETSDNEIMSARLGGLPKLRELEMHEKDLLSVELAELPGLETVDLRGEGSIQRLSGLVHLPLAEIDPVSPAAGGPNHFPVRATIRTRRGVARIYLKYEIDLRGRAEALAGYTDPERPWIEFGDTRSEEDVVEGYTFAEARPGKPDSTSGEAHPLVDRLLVWVEGLEGAEGIEYVIESAYR